MHHDFKGKKEKYLIYNHAARILIWQGFHWCPLVPGVSLGNVSYQDSYLGSFSSFLSPGVFLREHALKLDIRYNHNFFLCHFRLRFALGFVLPNTDCQASERKMFL